MAWLQHSAAKRRSHGTHSQNCIQAGPSRWHLQQYLVPATHFLHCQQEQGCGSSQPCNIQQQCHN